MMKTRKDGSTIEDLAVVQTGTLSIEAGEHYSTVFSMYRQQFKKMGDSAVVRITYRGKHYLVDTGYEDEWNLEPAVRELNKKKLEYNLGLLDLTFENIEGIFITHWHHDHFGNCGLFPRAKLYAYELCRDLNLSMIAKQCGFEHMMPPVYCKEGDMFAGCSLLPTPGHTKDHCSILAEFKGRVFCIAGDAIVSQSYYERGEVWPYNSGNMGKETCVRAMNSIIEKVDFIIPGHGHLFQNYRKK
jgi:glyoxylase-like metal-dependent hydrolase (beta-lactamase superfamily II)